MGGLENEEGWWQGHVTLLDARRALKQSSSNSKIVRAICPEDYPETVSWQGQYTRDSAQLWLSAEDPGPAQDIAGQGRGSS